MKKAPKLKALKSSYKEQPVNTDHCDIRPCIQFSEVELPEIKKWMIDGKYKLIIEVEMKGIREAEYGANRGKKVADFRVTKVGMNQ